MRYLIISDIHANWEGLEAVLGDAEGRYDSVICCGDVAGYCADPNATTDWVREHAAVTVRGNHDKAVAGSSDIEWFNDAARAATLWTRETLTEENMEFLKNLPRGPIQLEGFQVFHGSPLDEDDYIVTPRDASRLFGYLQAPLSFFGHTHLQGGFLVHRNGIRQISQVEPTLRRQELICPADFVVLANPGSVGQPREPRQPCRLRDVRHRRKPN